MNQIILGVRFISKMSGTGEFISRSEKIYPYIFDAHTANEMIGNICSMQGYSNFVVPVTVFKESENAKLISAKRITCEIEVVAAEWRSDSITDDTCAKAMRLYQRGSLIETPFDDDDEGVPLYEKEYTNNYIKENNNMDMLNNMTFGPYTNPRVAISFYGIAVQNMATKRWNSYKGNESYDVSDFLMKGMNNMIFAMPVAIKKIAVGDVILHNGTPMIVQTVNENTLEAVDVSNSEMKQIMPAKSPFGFNFCTKLISMFDGGMFGGDDNDDDDFFGGNPMMMMMMFNGQSDGGENNMSNIMNMMFMSKMMKNLG